MQTCMFFSFCTTRAHAPRGKKMQRPAVVLYKLHAARDNCVIMTSPERSKMGDIAAQRDSFKTSFAAIILYKNKKLARFVQTQCRQQQRMAFFCSEINLWPGFVEHEIETSDDASLSANKFHRQGRSVQNASLISCFN